MTAENGKPLTTRDALEHWREAERDVAVSRRGHEASQAAVAAAAQAREAAEATADAAKAALESMALAEASASKTVQAAKAIHEATQQDLTDARGELSSFEEAEARAHDAYREASSHARPMKTDF
jgi:hypothetical protein